MFYNLFPKILALDETAIRAGETQLLIHSVYAEQVILIIVEI